jgi:acyl-CoA thioester hydrolase
MRPFCWPARVYWEDTDGGGVVYYANYLRFLERARTEWLRALGFSQQALAQESGIVFTVAGVKIDYRSPARLDDELLVTCEPQSERAASLEFVQRVLRSDTPSAFALQATADKSLEEHALLATAEVRVACVDAQSFRPQRLPESLREAVARTRSG